MISQKPKAQASSKSVRDPFTAVPGFSALYETRNKKLGAFAIRLISGDICLFSPLPDLTEQIKASLQRLGGVSILFAPNHYHNKGLCLYSEAFPSAKLVAAAAAIPRLKKVTGLSFAPVNELVGKLPDNITLLEPEGLKTGENWLRIREKEKTAWIVVDAFRGAETPQSEPTAPQLLKNFPKYGLADRGRYVKWGEQQVRLDRPTTLLSCHGQAIHDAMLPEKLLDLILSL